jgi:hypothetical protein
MIIILFVLGYILNKINSIGYGHKIIGLAGLFLAVIPILFYVLHYFIQLSFFLVFIYVSLVIGFLISIFFIGLLIIEFYQDKNINKQYSIIKKTKLLLNNGFYECQSCGNKKVGKNDKNCDVCGIKFTIDRLE